jgi:hypothetical protein
VDRAVEAEQPAQVVQEQLVRVMLVEQPHLAFLAVVVALVV